VIRVALIEDRSLMRGQRAVGLADEPDITVVGELEYGEGGEGVARQAAEVWPDVIVINTDYMTSQILPTIAELRARIARCSVIILADPNQRGMLPPRRRARGLSFLIRDAPAALLAEAVRQVASGERLIHPRLQAAALRTDKEISTRELEVLGLAAEGIPVTDIAQRLYLSAGTVRNHLSAAITKTGARNRIDAIRIARKDGWLR
jgi:two-component system response regulator DesR